MRWRGLKEINTSNLLHHTTQPTNHTDWLLIVNASCPWIRAQRANVLLWYFVINRSANIISVNWSFFLINTLFHTVTLKVRQKVKHWISHLMSQGRLLLTHNLASLVLTLLTEPFVLPTHLTRITGLMKCQQQLNQVRHYQVGRKHCVNGTRGYTQQCWERVTNVDENEQRVLVLFLFPLWWNGTKMVKGEFWLG